MGNEDTQKNRTDLKRGGQSLIVFTAVWNRGLAAIGKGKPAARLFELKSGRRRVDVVSSRWWVCILTTRVERHPALIVALFLRF